MEFSRTTLADLNIQPALHFRCAVEDRDPVYSVEPVPTLVFGARCFSWKSDLWSRLDRTWTTPSYWTGGLNYGPVSTWYRLRGGFFSDRPRFVAARSVKPVRSRNERSYFGLFGLIITGSCPFRKLVHPTRDAAPRNNDHCPLERMQTLSHKTHPVSLWLSFSDSLRSVAEDKKLIHPEGDAAALPSLCHCSQWT